MTARNPILRALKNKAAAVLLPLFLCASVLHAQQSIRLVESVPEETYVGSQSIQNTADVWLEMFRNAKQSIDIETFYFADRPGTLLNDIITELKRAAERGVRIRIIVDSSFYAANEKGSDALEGIDGIEIRKIPLRNIAGGVMHAKYFITDRQNIFLGSQNMDWRALIHIHEMGVAVTDRKLAETFTEIFETDWKLCEGNMGGILNQRLNLVVNRENPVVLNDNVFGTVELFPAVSPVEYSPAGMNSELTELKELLRKAGDSVNVQIYSYSLKGGQEGEFLQIDSVLRETAARGVKIRIILPDWATRPGNIDAIKALSVVPNIAVKIISYPLHSGGFIPYARVDHCKYFTVDSDVSWVGTSNWERSYFFNSRNISLIMKNNGINSELNKVFEISWNSPYAEPVDVNRIYEEVKRK